MQLQASRSLRARVLGRDSTALEVSEIVTNREARIWRSTIRCCGLRRSTGLVGFLAVGTILALGCASLSSTNPDKRTAALRRVHDQTVLERFAKQDPDPRVRSAATEKLADPLALVAIAIDDKDESVARIAVKKLRDETLLARVALDKDPTLKENPGITYGAGLRGSLHSGSYRGDPPPLPQVERRETRRTAAVGRISDQAILTRIALHGQDERTVQCAAEKVTDQNALMEIALGASLGDAAVGAASRLSDGSMLTAVALGAKNAMVALAAAKRLTDQSALARIATEAPLDFVRLAAVERLTSQEHLLSLVQGQTEWEIRDAAFQRLDRNSLNSLAQRLESSDLALAASLRLGSVSWAEVFTNARRAGGGLSDAIGAAALVRDPQPDASAVVELCHTYIRQGVVARIPDLCALLIRFGDQLLAEDYLNCGRQELETAGTEWASSRGYTIRRGYGSHRVVWGAGNGR